MIEALLAKVLALDIPFRAGLIVLVVIILYETVDVKRSLRRLEDHFIDHLRNHVSDKN